MIQYLLYLLFVALRYNTLQTLPLGRKILKLDRNINIAELGVKVYEL